MATSKHSGLKQFRSGRSSVRRSLAGKSGGSFQPPRSWLIRAGLGLLALGLFGVVWYGADLRRASVTGTAYGARMACSCHYIGGRSLADCRKDFEPGMGLISLWEDEASHSITARLPLLASQTARMKPGQGCVLEVWR